ncbi:siderophore-interacting protein [Tersicoccus solisilvae]|uniref:Siderophore-interacting protein n=1 Tax=Tersicoccus solisilvae TaxID=1882339 RepID=A0ABQ1P5D7_9MICC|nr:siderophore-interacting protein [Tersicoccus solisilvae]GGC91391.1 siderophore-interacting protein [Tersicoccus solisilvae]
MPGPRPHRPRVTRAATVTGSEWLTRDLVRLHLTGPDLASLESPAHTDSYVKLLFAPPGADDSWPFDPDRIQAERPREQWPVTRTYTIRRLDPARAEMDLDVVVHGEAGLAGPWAASARPGQTIGFRGPGGAWSPDPGADHHLLVGDESAYPAIAAALDALPDDARASVFLEVADVTAHPPLRQGPGIRVSWVHRAGADGAATAPGAALAAAVRSADLPAGDLRAFVHGNAEMIKDLRRYLLVEQGLPRDRVSISGYWRTGQTEDAWQAGKREFVVQMEREQDGAAAG